MGMAIPTYCSHENGGREFGRDHAARYARALGVDAAYLLMLTAENGEAQVQPGDDLTLHYLRRIDKRLDGLAEDVRAIMVRVTNVEEGLVLINRRLDRIETRLNDPSNE
jgi:hypothetical protein